MSLNPRHLTSLEAIARHGSFSAAGAAIGRSHSAISLHVKALEAELGTMLVDRTTRPPVLTPDGIALAEQAARYRSVMEDIRALGRSNRLTGTLSVGIVPTAMTHLAPAALARLRVSHPALSIEIRTGLSGGLAQAVRAAEIDAAVLTAPDLAPDGLRVHPVLDEPLVVIAPPDVSEATDRTLLTAHPFIWFSRATWAGQQIERRLLDRGIAVAGAMEVDSLEAIEALVHHRLGVSIVPDRSTGRGLRRVPFGNPQVVRRLVLVTRDPPAKERLTGALLRALTAG